MVIHNVEKVVNHLKLAKTINSNFLKWIGEGINDGSIDINTASSFLHVVPEGLFFVSPLAFKTFAKNSSIPNIDYMLVMQSLFSSEPLLFERRDNKRFVFNYEVKHKNKGRKSMEIHGVVLLDSDVLNLVKELPSANEYLVRNYKRKCFR